MMENFCLAQIVAASMDKAYTILIYMQKVTSMNITFIGRSLDPIQSYDVLSNVTNKHCSPRLQVSARNILQSRSYLV